MSRFVRPLFALLLLFAGALPTAAFAQSADLSVIIADQSAYSVDRGDTLTFSITVINGGPDATVATLTNQLVTSDLTATSLSGPGATCTLGTLQCTMALGDGESTVITLVTDVSMAASPGAFPGIKAFVTGTTYDPSTDEGNEASAFALVNGAAIADLGVSVAGPSGIEAGHTGTFTAELVNAGPADAIDVAFNLVIDAPIGSTVGTVTGPGGWSCAGSNCTIATMPAGATASFAVDVTVVGSAPIGTELAATTWATQTSTDNNSENDSSRISVYVVGPATTTALSATPSDPLVGDTVTLSATVTPTSGGPVNSGTVTFYDTGWVPLATANVSSTGTATLTTSTLAAGAHDLVAIYTGLFGQFQDSTSSAQTVTVHKHDTTTTLATSPNPVVFGETVTLTATVAGSGGGTPTGNVTFYDGGTVLGTVALSGSTATFATDALGTGDHNLTASYGGDDRFAISSSAGIVQTTSPAPSGITLASSVNPSVIGTSVTFSVTVASTSGTPTGSVTFYDGAAAIGTATLRAGHASLATPDMTLGEHAITAVYGGDTNFVGSSSAVLTQQVLVDTAAVEAVFNKLTEDFVGVRGKLLSSNIKPPGLRGGQRTGASFGGSAETPELNFAMSSRSLTGAGSAAESLALGEVADAPFGFWIDGTLALHQRPGAGGQFALIGMGADYLVSDSLLAGVALYLDYMTDTTSAGDVVGRGALVGPYISAELADGLFFDASFLVGRSWNDAHAELFGADFSGSFATTRWMLNSSLRGDIDLGEFQLRPDVSVAAASETSDAYTVTGGGASVVIGAVTVETLRISAGTTISRAFELGNGLTLTPSLGVRLGSAADGAVAFDNVFGALTGGLTLAGDNWKVTGEAQLNGDSTGLRSQSVRLGVGGRF